MWNSSATSAQFFSNISSAVLALSAATGFFGVQSAAGQMPTDDAVAARARIDMLMDALGDEQFEKREDAECKLIELGEDALPALTSGLRSDDIEIRKRIEKVIEQIGFRAIRTKGAYIAPHGPNTWLIFKFLNSGNVRMAPTYEKTDKPETVVAAAMKWIDENGYQGRYSIRLEDGKGVIEIVMEDDMARLRCKGNLFAGGMKLDIKGELSKREEKGVEFRFVEAGVNAKQNELDPKTRNNEKP